MKTDAKYRQQKARLEAEAARRLNRIREEKVGRDPSFGGRVQVGDFSEEKHLSDAERLADIWPQMSEGSAMALWTDGSCKSDRGFADALGASVVMKEEGADGWGWREMPFVLGKDTGSSTDAELYAIAAAVAFAAKEVEEASPVQLVRIFSDCARVLEGIEDGTLSLLGPAVSSPWAIQTLYDSTRFLAEKGVKVELVWVKGHASSEGNKRADAVAKGAAQEAAAGRKEKGWVKRDSVPQGIEDQGEDSVEEWYWRQNKERMLLGEKEGDGEKEVKVDDATSQGSADMDVSDEDVSDN